MSESFAQSLLTLRIELTAKLVVKVKRRDELRILIENHTNKDHESYEKLLEKEDRLNDEINELIDMKNYYNLFEKSFEEQQKVKSP